MVLTDSIRLFQFYHRSASLLYRIDRCPVICTVYLSLIWDIVATADSTSGAFLRTFQMRGRAIYNYIGKLTLDSHWTVSLNSGRETKHVAGF